MTAYILVKIFTAGKSLAEFIVTETSILSCAIKTIDNDSEEKPDHLPTKMVSRTNSDSFPCKVLSETNKL